MQETINFTLNGKQTRLTVDSEETLLWVLRTELDLTGAKFGCGIGQCGSCTVVVDGEAVRSCQYPVTSVNGSTVLTIEGLEQNGKLHPIQEAFVQHGAFQCGFCTSGMILQAYVLLTKYPDSPIKKIIAGLEGNLCRCGAHQRIVQAVETAASEM
jgi:nicotinate dehydrogenase subunit A